MHPLLFSCKKEKQGKSLCFDGVVRWTGDPAADGLGWAIFADDSTAVYRPFIPQNLPDAYKANELKIAVCVSETDEKFYCMCAVPLNKYRIGSIKRR